MPFIPLTETNGTVLTCRAVHFTGTVLAVQTSSTSTIDSYSRFTRVAFLTLGTALLGRPTRRAIDAPARVSQSHTILLFALTVSTSNTVFTCFTNNITKHSRTTSFAFGTALLGRPTRRAIDASAVSSLAAKKRRCRTWFARDSTNDVVEFATEWTRERER